MMQHEYLYVLLLKNRLCYCRERAFSRISLNIEDFAGGVLNSSVRGPSARQEDVYAKIGAPTLQAGLDGSDAIRYSFILERIFRNRTSCSGTIGARYLFNVTLSKRG